MSGLTALTIAEIRDGLAARAFSASELTRAYIAAIEAARNLNAYIVETPEKALRMAAESDRPIAAGEARRLEGVPLGIKDLFCTEGVHSQAASHVLDGFKPVTNRPSPPISWPMAPSCSAAQHGRVRHGLVQRNLLLRPGGQSRRARGSDAPLVPGGCRAARRRGRGPPLRGATATDTGGSIRQPAAFTGTVGISRPTAAVRAGASSRSPPCSTRPGRLHAPSAMPRSCSVPWRAPIRRTPPRRTFRYPTTRRPSARA